LLDSILNWFRSQPITRPYEFLGNNDASADHIAPRANSNAREKAILGLNFQTCSTLFVVASFGDVLMKEIVDWLEANTSSDRAFTLADKTDVEQQAEIVRAKAEAAGYSAAELNEACGGDIAEYIINRQVYEGSTIAHGKMRDNASPLIPPGFKLQ
jgi:hypothetical protein